MKKRWMPLVLFMLVGSVFIASCANRGLVLSSKDSFVNQIKNDALKRERMLEKHMFIHEPIIFDFNGTEILPSAKALLNRKVSWLLANPDTNVIVKGHCDSLGDDSYNLVLGEQRGKAVKTFMNEMNISESRMKVVSYGEGDLVDSGKTEEELVKNRRVTFCFDN